MEKNSYSRSEVLAAAHALPERGPLCHECGARIPVFEELSDADEERVRQCMRDNRVPDGNDGIARGRLAALLHGRNYGSTTMEGHTQPNKRRPVLTAECR